MSTQNASKIPIEANKVSRHTVEDLLYPPSHVRQGVTGALFGVAVITAIGRTYIRARILKQWGIEDGLLAFAVVCLCGTITLSYLTVDYSYNAVDAILLGAGNSPGALLAQVPLMTKVSDAAGALWWLVIFSVKLAYLFFFRRLIIRVHGLNRWWWCVMVFMVCVDCLEESASRCRSSLQ